MDRTVRQGDVVPPSALDAAASLPPEREADDFDLLMHGFQRGDERAIQQVLELYEADVRLAVRRWLPQRLRGLFDSMDFVQAVWASVLADGVDLSDSPQFEGPHHLLGYLTAVARNKVWEEYRRRTRTQKYDLGREEPLYVRSGGREQPLDLASADPSPSAFVQAKDQFDRMVSDRDPTDVEILRLRRDGLTNEEISAEVGVSERTIRRKIKEIQKHWEQRRWP